MSETILELKNVSRSISGKKILKNLFPAHKNTRLDGNNTPQKLNQPNLGFFISLVAL